MNEAETIIRAMSKSGSPPGAIAGELYDRGIKNGLGMPYTSQMISGYLRYVDGEGPKEQSRSPGSAVEAPKAPPYRHSKEGEPITEPRPKVRMLRPWPLHTDFRPDNLQVGD